MLDESFELAVEKREVGHVDAEIYRFKVGLDVDGRKNVGHWGLWVDGC
jgi:hypothetical protein